MSIPFPSPEVVAAVCQHMNDDHPEDSLLICRTLGGQPEATSARATGVDAEAIEFVVTVGAAEVPVRIPFAERLTERGQIRHEVVRMYREACEQAGVPPRTAD